MMPCSDVVHLWSKQEQPIVLLTQGTETAVKLHIITKQKIW